MAELTDKERARKPTEHETLLAWAFLDGLTGLQAEDVPRVAAAFAAVRAEGVREGLGKAAGHVREAAERADNDPMLSMRVAGALEKEATALERLAKGE